MHPKTWERRILHRTGRSWFMLMPFVNGTVLHHWAAANNRRRARVATAPLPPATPEG